MIITFSGHNGSGKTTVSKRLASELGYDWWGMAEITRAHAKSLGMTIQQHDEYAAKNPGIDLELDEQLSKLADRTRIVVDSRAGWHFLPDSKKIFITADENVRARRAYENPRVSEKYASLAAAKEGLAGRIEVFENRLKKLYGIEVYNPDNFDLVIDSSDRSVDSIIKEIRDYIQL